MKKKSIVIGLGLIVLFVLLISPHKIPVDYDLNLGIPPEYVFCKYPAQESSSEAAQQLKTNNNKINLKVEDLGRRTVVKVEASAWRNLPDNEKKQILNNVHSIGLKDQKVRDTLVYSCQSDNEKYLAYKLSKNETEIELIEWTLLGYPIKKLSY